MTNTEYALIENPDTPIKDKTRILDKYTNKENRREQKLFADILDGSTEEFRKKFLLFPIGKIPSPVRIPCWMFRSFPDDPEFELTDIQKVALAHVIHFTRADNPCGYLECSGNIENWCRVSTDVAHKTLQELVSKNMIFEKDAPEDLCMGHKRNKSYVLNVDYLHTILSTYNTDIWM